jgi:hypothetical protein
MKNSSHIITPPNQLQNLLFYLLQIPPCPRLQKTHS